MYIVNSLDIFFKEDTDISIYQLLEDSWKIYNKNNEVYEVQDAFMEILPYVKDIQISEYSYSEDNIEYVDIDKFISIKNGLRINIKEGEASKMKCFIDAFYHQFTGFKDFMLNDIDKTEHDKNDPINPNHYRKGNIEVIDVIETYTKDLKGIQATDTGNIIKYILRWKNKNGLEDLKKAKWYLDHLIKQLEGGTDGN